MGIEEISKQMANGASVILTAASYRMQDATEIVLDVSLTWLELHPSE